MAVFWVVAPYSLAEVYRRLRGACLRHKSASETSINYYQTTRRNKSEDSHLQTQRRENLKSHISDSHGGEDIRSWSFGL
jgi:hypothetical protein